MISKSDIENFWTRGDVFSRVHQAMSETGLINSSQNIQALTEDFWFARKEGAGSSVDIYKVASS